jgi:hypothetical protein
MSKEYLQYYFLPFQRSHNAKSVRATSGGKGNETSLNKVIQERVAQRSPQKLENVVLSEQEIESMQPTKVEKLELPLTAKLQQ